MIDDASDYYNVDNQWISKQQQKNLQKINKQRDEQRNNKQQKITIDFAGRRVYNDVRQSDDRL